MPPPSLFWKLLFYPKKIMPLEEIFFVMPPPPPPQIQFPSYGNGKSIRTLIWLIWLIWLHLGHFLQLYLRFVTHQNFVAVLPHWIECSETDMILNEYNNDNRHHFQFCNTLLQCDKYFISSTCKHPPQSPQAVPRVLQ